MTAQLNRTTFLTKPGPNPPGYDCVFICHQRQCVSVGVWQIAVNKVYHLRWVHSAIWLQIRWQPNLDGDRYFACGVCSALPADPRLSGGPHPYWPRAGCRSFQGAIVACHQLIGGATCHSSMRVPRLTCCPFTHNQEDADIAGGIDMVPPHNSFEKGSGAPIVRLRTISPYFSPITRCAFLDRLLRA